MSKLCQELDLDEITAQVQRVLKRTSYLSPQDKKKKETNTCGGGWGGGGCSGIPNFNRGKNWRRPGDPLILDLNGGGVRVSASSSQVLFDSDADRVKTGTQWASSGDGFLVRDINGNGDIGSGRELFGDQTLIAKTIYANGQVYAGQGLATTGFEALRPLDKDAAGASDGQINASDVAYSQLQVWQDTNQDGISQADELQTLAQRGITSISLAQTTLGVATPGRGTIGMAGYLDIRALTIQYAGLKSVAVSPKCVMVKRCRFARLGGCKVTKICAATDRRSVFMNIKTKCRDLTHEIHTV